VAHAVRSEQIPYQIESTAPEDDAFRISRVLTEPSGD